MWGTFLSEPLDIVGLGSRYLSNYLMSRMPILIRISSFLTVRCLIVIYAVLDEVSLDYPPDKARLHTCYSPVRRSPPVYCYTVLPLDLHVLSLSLAFILSQDQTLRCSYSFFLLFFCL